MKTIHDITHDYSVIEFARVIVRTLVGSLDSNIISSLIIGIKMYNYLDLDLDLVTLNGLGQKYPFLIDLDIVKLQRKIGRRAQE